MRHWQAYELTLLHRDCKSLQCRINLRVPSYPQKRDHNCQEAIRWCRPAEHLQSNKYLPSGRNRPQIECSSLRQSPGGCPGCIGRPYCSAFFLFAETTSIFSVKIEPGFGLTILQMNCVVQMNVQLHVTGRIYTSMTTIEQQTAGLSTFC